MTPNAPILLVVNDAQGTCAALCGSLPKDRWVIVKTPPGAEALERCKQYAPHLVLLPMKEAEASEYATAQQLKSDPMTCQVPLVAVGSALQASSASLPWLAGSLAGDSSSAIAQAVLDHILAHQRQHQPHVLIVDDEPDLLEITSEILRERGICVSQAVDGAEALDILRAVQPDTMVLDLEMPRCDGWTVLRWLKDSKDPTGKRTRIVILTGAYRSDDDRHQGLALGAIRYLLKPCDPEVLVRAVAGKD